MGFLVLGQGERWLTGLLLVGLGFRVFVDAFALSGFVIWSVSGYVCYSR